MNLLQKIQLKKQLNLQKWFDGTLDAQNTSADDNTANVTDAVAKEAHKEDIAIVHAVGVFRNSPNETLGQDDVNSIQKYIHSEEHLTRNIVRIEFEQPSKWEINMKLFVPDRIFRSILVD